MEAGKTVEKQETRGSLREQDSIRALLELLEQQGMEQEKGDVIRMADHIDSMEMQLGTGRGEEAIGRDAGKQDQTLCGGHYPESRTSGENAPFSGRDIQKKVCGTGRTGSV